MAPFAADPKMGGRDANSVGTRIGLPRFSLEVNREETHQQVSGRGNRLLFVFRLSAGCWVMIFGSSPMQTPGGPPIAVSTGTSVTATAEPEPVLLRMGVRVPVGTTEYTVASARAERDQDRLALRIEITNLSDGESFDVSQALAVVVKDDTGRTLPRLEFLESFDPVVLQPTAAGTMDVYTSLPDPNASQLSVTIRREDAITTRLIFEIPVAEVEGWLPAEQE